MHICLFNMLICFYYVGGGDGGGWGGVARYSVTVNPACNMADAKPAGEIVAVSILV